MKKIKFFTEAGYFIGIILLALSSAILQKCDFGLSMVIAPAYILHLKLSEIIPWFSFGMAAYTVQFIIIVILWVVMRRFNAKYLLSFATAVFYGFTLDFFVWTLSFVSFTGLALRIILFFAGITVCAVGVALIFNTYLPPESYELFVKEISKKYGFDIGKTKTVYDLSSCAIAVLLSFIFFGWLEFKGVSFGTLICALLNGTLIGCASKLLHKVFDFKDGLPLRKYFE